MSDQNIAPAIHERKGHTPGPWSAIKHSEPNDDMRCAVVANRGNLAYLVATIENGAPGDYCDTEWSNACLIAEAPNLLVHLKFAVALLGPLCGGTAQVEAMRAAITKAEG